LSAERRLEIARLCHFNWCVHNTTTPAARNL
jgi:hypothetical protein